MNTPRYSRVRRTRSHPVPVLTFSRRRGEDVLAFVAVALMIALVTSALVSAVTG